MRKPLSMLIAGACISLASAAFAAEGTMDKAKLMSMDDNSDGVVTKEEYTKHKGDPAMWSKMDSNNDGKLDINELGFQHKSNVEKKPATQ